MMGYTNKQRFIFKDTFFRHVVTFLDNMNDSSINFKNCNVFNKMFVIDVSSKEIEVPIFARYMVEQTYKGYLSHIGEQNTFNKIVIPLYSNGPDEFVRSASAAVLTSFSKIHFPHRMQRFIIKQNFICYGSMGILLDKDLNILFLMSVKSKILDMYGIETLSYYKPIIYINPEVFMDSKNLLNKYIINKLIPFYSLNTLDMIDVSGLRLINDIPIKTKPQIIIDDMSRFLTKPSVPSFSEHLDEELNELLINNIEEITSQF